MPYPSSPDELYELTGEEELRVFRAVRSDDHASEAFLDSFRSNAARGKKPRAREKEYPLLHAAISTWTTREVAAAIARRYPAHGAYVTEVVLTSAHGARWFEIPPDGHISVWGDPEVLAGCATDTLPLDN